MNQVLTERTPRVVSAVKLHRNRERNNTGLFLAEGANSVEAALGAGRVRELFYTEAAGERYALLVARASNASLVDERAMDRLADTVTPVGLVAVCEHVDVPVESVVSAQPKLVVFLADVNEPGNAGTIIRIVDAVGADAVILAGESVDPHNGKCVRATAGSLFHVPIVRAKDSVGTLALLREAGLGLVAADGKGELSLDAASGAVAGPTAWIFGSEAHGVPEQLLEVADHRIAIPIRGRAESLNLATAAAICLYESAKAQRSR